MFKSQKKHCSNQQNLYTIGLSSLYGVRKSLFCVCRVNETKFTGIVHDAIEIKCFIVISLMKQILLLVTPIDIKTTL